MSQKEFWNNKFSSEDYFYGIKANEFLASKKELFNKHNKLLCLGEGEGRNAIFFAKNGFEVTAIDASDLGLEKLQKRATEEKLGVFINPLEDQFLIKGSRYRITSWEPDTEVLDNHTCKVYSVEKI